MNIKQIRCNRDIRIKGGAKIIGIEFYLEY